jgi:hypothetical protein
MNNCQQRPKIWIPRVVVVQRFDCTFFQKTYLVNDGQTCLEALKNAFRVHLGTHLLKAGIC